MNAIELYQKILFLELRPWQMNNLSDLKFKHLILDIKKEYYTHQPNYEVVFCKPLSYFRKYYNNLIEYSAINFLNEFYSEIQLTSNKSEIAYLVNQAINKKLSQKLKEIDQVIQSRNYTPEQFDLNSPNKAKDPTIADESYVIHLLKYHMIRLFMDIQETYKNELHGEYLSKEEIFYKYFNENPPSQEIIIEADNFPNTNPIIKTSTEETKPTFNPIRDDIRPNNTKVLLFEQIIKNPSRFSHIEELMYEKELIDDNYNFKDKYGIKRYLAALYHQLIRKGYFNSRYFPENKEIEPLMIRKFLDYRYNSNIDKQFRTWNNDQAGLLNFIEKDYWLDNISAC
ncbi:DUF6617 family protein [Marinifilum sp. RC60d5]|uniref:DUF6617 family protein n=1 Tax=Marinifilum sp. RC60d5 TaxID=3458414 RepID=UPI004035BC11